MSAPQNRILYMNEQGMSDRDIEKLTGIPRSTIGFVRRGDRGMPSEYLTPLRNTYRRVAYHSLRDEGLPYHQAGKYSSGSVTTVKETTFTTRSLVTQFTRGAITGALAKLQKQGIIPNMKDLAMDMLGRVKRGLRKSHKDLEQYKDYMTRKYEPKDMTHEEQEQSLKDLGW